MVRIPPELWIKVIREATSLPEALDTTLQDALPPRGTPAGLYSQEVTTMMRDSLSTKWAISLVCKTWHSICLEFFYEFVMVRDAHSLPRLVSLLSRLGAAKWVQRLDYAYYIPSPYDRGYRVAHRFIPAAAGLIRLCQNLRIFSCRTTGEENSTVLRANARYLPKALMHVAGTLESIHWQSPFISPDPSFLLDLHQRCPRLRSVFPPDVMSPFVTLASQLDLDAILGPTKESEDESDGDGTHHTYPLEQDSSLRCQSLHTIPLLNDVLWPHVHEVANGLLLLRHVVVTSFQSPDILKSFISNNPQIETVTFNPGAMRFIVDFTLTTIRTVIFPLKDLCTNIMFQSVERVGLTGTEELVPEYYGSAFDQLLGESGGEQFPNLRLIRFVDAILARTLENRNLQFKLLDRKCRSKGVRLEDERGQLMVPRQ